MGTLLVKPGVQFGHELAPAGARILEVLKTCVLNYDFDVTITSGRDGEHSGTGDPHHSGEAFDLRVHGLTEAQISRLVNDLQAGLYRDPRRFYVVLEGSQGPSAHIHCQRHANTTYTVDDFLHNR